MINRTDSMQDIVKVLAATKDRAEKAAIIAEFILSEQPEPIAHVVRRCVILHWFDQPLIEAMLKEYHFTQDRIKDIYEQIITLPFVERLPWGFTLQDLTREGLLKRYASTQPDLLASAARLAAPIYEAHQNNKADAEALFCYIVAGNSLASRNLIRRLTNQARERGDEQYINNLQEMVNEAWQIPAGLADIEALLAESTAPVSIKRGDGGKTAYILIVDDDQFANTLVQFVLIKEGYDVETTDNPRGALQMIQRREPDLLILDVSMPYLNGFDFSDKLREEGYEIPIIFITALDSIEAKLKGFNIGANDYICKPYNHQELVARVQAVLRRIKRYGHAGNQSIRNGHLELFPDDLKVVVGGQEAITLTPREMHILRVLMASSGQTVKRDQLLAEVWDDHNNSSNIVDVYIRRLRYKLEEDVRRPRRIVSVRGVGYKFIGK